MYFFFERWEKNDLLKKMLWLNERSAMAATKFKSVCREARRVVARLSPSPQRHTRSTYHRSTWWPRDCVMSRVPYVPCASFCRLVEDKPVTLYRWSWGISSAGRAAPASCPTAIAQVRLPAGLGAPRRWCGWQLRRDRPRADTPRTVVPHTLLYVNDIILISP